MELGDIMPEDRGPLGILPVGPVRKAIRGIVGSHSESGEQKTAHPETTPLDEYVRGLARFSGEPEGAIWRSGQVREYARKFGLTDVLEDKLRRLP